MATDGVDCQGALDLYEESLTLAKSMAAHNFFGNKQSGALVIWRSRGSANSVASRTKSAT